MTKIIITADVSFYDWSTGQKRMVKLFENDVVYKNEQDVCICPARSEYTFLYKSFSFIPKKRNIPKNQKDIHLEKVTYEK